MSMNIHNAIKNEYDRRQKQARDELVRRKEEVFIKIPRIKDIEDEITRLGLRYNKMILHGRSDADRVLHELSLCIERLKDEKKQLLLKNGYKPGYLEIAYHCSRCCDTGFIKSSTGMEKCFCYKQLLINYLYDQSNLMLAKTENFQFFDETLYPDDVDEKRYGIKKSPRENICGIREKCMKFIENFDSPEEKNLFFCGPAGVGKTFMANCIAAEIMKLGKTVLYQTAPLLFDTISDYKVRAFKDEYYEDTAYKKIFDVELLIIDDLGTESQSAARYAELLNILNTRQINNLSKPCKTIISTNIEPDKLFEFYTERVESRIIGSFALYKFAGKDIRKIKKLGRSK
jgi:DNA replication protein DnaC